MNVIITDGILKKEFPKGITENEKIVILRKAKSETTVAIKGINMPANTTLLKGYATSDEGTRRIVYLLRNASGQFILLFYRSKKDKIGENITIKNTVFANTLTKYLEIVLKDISENKFTILK